MGSADGEVANDPTANGGVSMPPLVHAEPLYLETDRLAWPQLQALTVDLSKYVEGARRAEEFGRNGQGQDGIDVHGFFDDGSVTAYQCKRVERFTVAILDSAVTEFLEGENPNDATRFVVVTSASALDTGVTNRLTELQRLHRQLIIELWGREHISDALRDQYQVVRRHFGQPNASAFCDSVPLPIAADTEQFDADSILRGPVESLNLAADLDAANTALETDPAAAAETYRAIAGALEHSAYAPHAARLRQREADAWRAAGDAEGVIKAELSILSNAVTTDDAMESQQALHRLSRDELDFPEDWVRSAHVLGAIGGFEHNRGDTLEEAVKHFDAMQENDPYRLEAAVHIVEHALAHRMPSVVADRADALLQLSASANRDEASLMLAARVAAAVADATSDWQALARDAKRIYPPKAQPLLLARYARHLVRQADPTAAIGRYYDAIQAACLLGHYADAADWTYAIQLVRIRYGHLGEINDLHRHATALRAQGNDSVVPSPFSPRERALSRLHDGKLPDALEAIRIYLRRTVTLGDWSGEHDAEELMAELLAKVSQPLQAVDHMITAGAREDLEKLAAEFPDAPIAFPVPDALEALPTWERACAYTFVAGVADFLSDEEAEAWAGVTLAEIEAANPSPWGTPDPFLTSFKAFSKLAVGSTPDQAERFLDVTEQYIQRDPNRYRFSDEQHAEALAGVALGHAGLRRRAVSQMCAALIADQRMGGIILSDGADALVAERDLVAELCRGAAAEGNDLAALALVITENDLAPAVDLARGRVARLTQPREHTPGTYAHYGGWENVALLSLALDPAERSALADTMVAAVRDKADVAGNRRLALRTLETLAPHLDASQRRRLFATALAAAKGDLDGSANDDLFPDSPLGRFRMSMGSTSLRLPGLRAAATLAVDDDQVDAVVELAKSELDARDEQLANAVAVALSRLPREKIGLDAGSLAVSSSDSVRALAAMIWCATDFPPTLGVQLAADRSALVRRTLHANLSENPEHDDVRAILARDPRRSIRRRLDS
jgi:hypothetical protein